MRASVSLHLQLRISRILAKRFYVIGNEVSYDIKNRLSFRTSGSLSKVNCNLSDYPSMRLDAPGPRYPLDPAILRHVLLSLSALSAEGRIIP